MMVDAERSYGTGSGTDPRRDPEEILRESRGLLKQVLDLVDDLDTAIKSSREDAVRERGGGSHRWGL